MTLEQENKSIAEFMGFKTIPDSNGMCFTDKNYPFDTFHMDDFKYHSSWDWLMPVVEKILSRKMYHKIENSKNPMLGTHRLSNVKTSLMSACILTVYDAVIEFVEWYNENV